MMRKAGRFACALMLWLAATHTGTAITLKFSTYLGGNDVEHLNAVAVDASSNIYVVGQTFSTNFPTLNFYTNVLRSASDIVVSKFSSSGTLIYSTYIGSGGGDVGEAIAVDAAGNAYIVGQTGSGFDYPFTNGFQAAPGVIGTAGFITKLGPGGNTLVYSSYFGGSSNDEDCLAVAVDRAGNAYVAGYSTSTNLPVVNALQATNSGGRDGFIFGVGPAGTNLIFSTYLGGSGQDSVQDLALDDVTNVYITGDTASANFPTAQALYPTYRGGSWDGFIARLPSSGASLSYSTFFGGGSEDHLVALAVDAQSNVFVAGYGQSLDMPRTNAIQPVFGGYTWDAYLVGLAPSGTQLLFSTFYGGDDSEYVYDVDVDRAGNLYVVGQTQSAHFPLVDGRPFAGGVTDAFIVKLLAGGRRVLYATYLGGSSGVDGARGVAALPDGSAVVVGEADSLDFPVTNAFQATPGGNREGFVARIMDGPVMLSISNAGGVAVASWNTYSGVTYKAQANTDLVNGAWEDLILPVQGGAGSCCGVVTDVLDSARNYRAVITDPLLCTSTYASCSSYQDETAPASNRVVTFTFFSYTPSCLRIKAGQSVTFSGTFASHPFLWQCLQNGAVTNTPPSGSLGVFTFPTPGYYNYKCALHGDSFGMRGSIEVVP